MPTNADLSTVIVFVLYLVAVLAIGIWAYRKNNDMGDFAIGGRRLGTFVTTLSAKATDSSQWVFFGLPGAFYISGMRNIWLIIGLTIGFYLSWKLLAGRLRTYSSKVSDWRTDAPGESVTLPGFFANRFRSNSVRTASAIFIIIFYVIYLGSAFIATGVIFQQIFGGSVVTGTIVGAVVVMVYSSLGGYLASSYTDLVQGLLMWGSLIAVSVVAIAKVGGVGGFIEAISAENPDLGSPVAAVELVGDSWITAGSSVPFVAIVSALAWAFGYFGSPHILARFMGMRKAESARGGARLGLFLSITLLGSAGVVGFAAIAIFGSGLENPEDAYMALVGELFPSWVAGIFLAGVLSAVMSTADSQLVVASTTLTEDFYRAFINREAPQKTLVWLSRVAVLFCTGVGILVALRGGTILDLVGYAWAGFGASFGPALLAALYWRRATWFGALLSIIVGGSTVILYRMVDTIGLYELIPGFAAGLLALWLGSWLGPKKKQAPVTAQFDVLTAR
ncbi:sodium/proline symporter [Microbacterium sp. gxy059]|uniref:sodium/proline symporter n=1 Tax=Microbacterium sp. gxy059 TaxID=2957199 RepID=UPI003D9828F3